jgi:LmbE family N-acetylglucosaminyl deacetylase
VFTHQRILVVAAHPDDEVLGCGALCARMAGQGAEVSILILGEGPHPGSAPPGEDHGQAVTDLRRQAKAAASGLGAAPPYFGGFPDNRFDQCPLLDIIKRVEAVKARTRPPLVLTHHSGDLNIDHALTPRAVMTAFPPQPGAAPLDILAFEVLSSTDTGPRRACSPLSQRSS